MTNIYLSSTLKNDWNLEFNQKITENLEKSGLTVYLPQRDTNQQGDLDVIFKEDIKGMENARTLLVVAKNASENLWLEVGWGYAKDKLIMILADEADFVPAFAEKMATEIIKVKNFEDMEDYIGKLIENCLK